MPCAPPAIRIRAYVGRYRYASTVSSHWPIDSPLGEDHYRFFYFEYRKTILGGRGEGVKTADNDHGNEEEAFNGGNDWIFS